MRNEQQLTETLAELRSAGRRYRFFVEAELRNKNAARAFRKICGQSRTDTPFNLAADGDRTATDTHFESVTVDEDEQVDHSKDDAQCTAVDLPSKSRLPWGLTVELGAAPFDNAAAYMRTFRNSHARRVQKLVKDLPVYDWAVAAKGTGPMNLGLVLGETGDLGQYSNPAKVWKRMGLAVDSGEADRRRKGVHNGFSPTRRAIMHNLGECLLKQNDGVYRKAYDDRKAYELARNPEMPLIGAHKRALRFMEKLWLKDLWCEWRKATTAKEAA